MVGQLARGLTRAGLRATLALFLVACGTTDDGGGSTARDGGGGADTADAGVEQDAGDGVRSPVGVHGECTVGDIPANTPDTTRADSCPTAPWIVQVRGSVVDEAGAPVCGAKVQVCARLSPSGNLLCLAPEDTDPDGDYQIDLPENVRCVEGITMRMLAPRTDSATMYCRVPVDGGDPILDLETPAVLYLTDPAPEVPSDGGTVRFADGLEVDVETDRFFGPTADSYGRLSARRLDAEAASLCFLDGGSLDGLYAFSPEADVTGGHFQVRIPNDSGLAAGTDVDLFVLGGLSTTIAGEGGGSTEVEEADWHAYGTGVVSQDGAVVEAELPSFNWFGYRAR